MMDEIKALARIKILIKKYYEEIGRRETGEYEMEAMNVVEKIEDELDKVKIPGKYMTWEGLDWEDE